MSNKGQPCGNINSNGFVFNSQTLIIVLVKLKIGKPNWLYRYYLAQSQPALHGQAEWLIVYHRALVVCQ